MPKNGTRFDFSYGIGVIAIFRILGDREILIAANIGESAFDASILVDLGFEFRWNHNGSLISCCSRCSRQTHRCQHQWLKGKIAAVKATLARTKWGLVLTHFYGHH